MFFINHYVEIMINLGTKKSRKKKNIVNNTTSDIPDINHILELVIKNIGIQTIATHLNIAIGTIKRWRELKNIPKQYLFQLMKLNNMYIDYSKFSYKDKDQFYTPVETAKQCFKTFKKIIQKYNDKESDYTYIEPSAGSGNFLKILPENNTIAMDIDPKNNDILKQDFLLWKPTVNSKYITFGNPPFGLRGQLALLFINHSAKFSDYVCFILPQLFISDGKGVPRKRVQGLNLIHSEKIKSKFYDPNNNEMIINCIFQIWSKHHTNPDYIIQKINTSIVKIYSLSDGGTPSTTRNKKMFDKCHAYIPSTCFGATKMKYYDSFENLPRKKGYGVVFLDNKINNLIKFKNIDWTKVAFLSTNSAYNIRTSQIAAQFN